MTWNRIVSFAALLTLPLASGCYVYGHDDGYYGASGDVTFSWSFDGRNCYYERDIETVHITIPGERLDNDGYFPCTVNGYDGITLRNFAPGTYDFQIEAIDYSGFHSFYSSGHFTVDGSINVRVDLGY